ncbi:hypothetical protein [Vibrio antiquarius]|uniref:hypothetical protein n=1 Tax=Vibrio antiquarius (strain Ex25) TaxID=150340 RepID=UPI0026581E62|nr:hypothetical protein [Vibrio antiquarius]MCR9549574.1 hypothetical protein [Vibrio antiquarius]
MINRYENRINTFISHKKKIPLSFMNDLHKSISWDGKYFVFDTLAIVFVNTLKLGDRRIHRRMKCNDSEYLSKYYSDYLKAIALQFGMREFQPKTNSNWIVCFRHILSFLENKSLLISGINTKLVGDFFECNEIAKLSDKTKIILKGCFAWMIEQQHCPQHIRLPYVNFKQDTKQLVDCSNSRLPGKKSVVAAGRIFNDIMPDDKGYVDCYDDIRRKFVAGMLAISFSSPNRAAAEQLYLANKKLMSKVVKGVEGYETTIYMLDWQGSKGFSNWQKHMFNQMVPTLTRALHFFNKACEPARVLCRFMENPEASLKTVLGKFSIKGKPLHLERATTLWELGAILGFYDRFQEESRLKIQSIEGFPYNIDPNRILNLEEKLSFLQRKLGKYPSSNVAIDKMLPVELQGTKTVKQLQDSYIRYIKRVVPNFPYRIHKNGNSIRLSQALCVFTGAQVFSSSGKALANSVFMIEPYDMSSMYASLLKEYFIKSGYNESFSLSAHQPRHFMNTMCHEVGLSDEIIAEFSGRKNVTSNVVYNHQTEEERHAQVVDLYGGLSFEVKVITAAEYTSLIGRAATDTGVGLCLQDLTESPCSFFNDFEENCVGCPKSAHCKGDKEALLRMQQDLVIQEARLSEPSLNDYLSINPISQRWFKIHFTKVERYKALIDLMEDDEIPDGSLIRPLVTTLGFAVIDLKNRNRNLREIVLTDPSKKLQEIIGSAKSEQLEETELQRLIGKFDL